MLLNKDILEKALSGKANPNRLLRSTLTTTTLAWFIFISLHVITEAKPIAESTITTLITLFLIITTYTLPALTFPNLKNADSKKDIASLIIGAIIYLPLQTAGIIIITLMISGLSR